MKKEKEILEVLDIQVLIGNKIGIDAKKVTPGFFCRLSDAVNDFLKREGIDVLALYQGWKKDSEYKGASRDFHLKRNKQEGGDI